MAKRLPDDVLDYFRREGARGAKMQAANMTAAQRKARATKASKAAALARSKKKHTQAASDDLPLNATGGAAVTRTGATPFPPRSKRKQ
jgi:hypothetical protein